MLVAMGQDKGQVGVVPKGAAYSHTPTFKLRRQIVMHEAGTGITPRQPRPIHRGLAGRLVVC